MQNLSHVDSSELSPDMQARYHAGRLTRIDGFQTLRALSHALAAIGLPLEVFERDASLALGPLSASQRRHWCERSCRFLVYNEETEETQPEMPETFNALKTPVLVSISDQGPMNIPALDMISYKLRSHVVPLFDPFHRAWNDMKSSLRKAKLMRTFYGMSVIFNLNYGPGGTGAWMEKKRHVHRQMLAQMEVNSDFFMSYAEAICKERRWPPAESAHQQQELLDAFRSMETVRVKGPLMKLMRWFSYWTSNEFYKGELWMTKALLACGAADGCEDALLMPDPTLSPKEELRQLKMKHGSWAVAHALLTAKSFWENEVIVHVGRPTWTVFSHRASEVQTPEQAPRRFFCLTNLLDVFALLS